MKGGKEERERERVKTYAHLKPFKFGKFLPYFRPNVPFAISMGEINTP